MSSDQRTYVLAGPDGTTTTVHGSQELARVIAHAHEAGICLAFNGTDTNQHDSTHLDARDDHDSSTDADEF